MENLRFLMFAAIFFLNSCAYFNPYYYRYPGPNTCYGKLTQECADAGYTQAVTVVVYPTNYCKVRTDYDFCKKNHRDKDECDEFLKTTDPECEKQP